MKEAFSRHALNRQFDWQRRAPSSLRIITSAQAEAFEETGFIKIQGALDQRTLDAVELELDRLEACAGKDWHDDADGLVRISRADTITFNSQLVAKSPLLRSFSRSAVFRNICHDLIADAARLYWDQSVYKKSSNPQEFPWHQDNGYTFVEPQQYVTCWVPLVDVDEQNGCPWVIPALHRLGTLHHWPTEFGYKCIETHAGAIAVPARRGDIVVFSSLTPHRTGPNLRAGTVRKAYILQYITDGAQVMTDAGWMPVDNPETQYRII